MKRELLSERNKKIVEAVKAHGLSETAELFDMTKENVKIIYKKETGSSPLGLRTRTCQNCGGPLGVGVYTKYCSDECKVELKNKIKLARPEMVLAKDMYDAYVAGDSVTYQDLAQVHYNNEPNPKAAASRVCGLIHRYAKLLGQYDELKALAKSRLSANMSVRMLTDENPKRGRKASS